MMNLAMNFDTDECLVTAMFDKGNGNSNYVGFCEDKLISNSGNSAFYFDFSSIIFIRNKSTIIE